MSYVPDDVLASSNTTGRIGRFPRRKTRQETPYKREIDLPKNLIVFGTTDDRTRTHTLEIPLDTISSTLDDPEKRNVEVAKKEDRLRMVKQILSRMIKPQTLGSTDYKFTQDPSFTYKLNTLLQRVFHPDFENFVSNIQSINILSIPPKNEIIKELNKELANKGDKALVVGFSSIQQDVEKALISFGITDAKQILNQMGEKKQYVLTIGADSNMTAISPLNFYKKHYIAFKDKNWKIFEKYINIPTRENNSKLIRLFKKYNLTFFY